MIKKLSLIIISLFLLQGILFSQKWIKNIETSKQESPGFYYIQQAFYDKYGTQPTEENIKTFKKFKRWEWFLQSRVDNSGFFPVRTLWNESKKTLNTRQYSENNSNWSCLGPFGPPNWKTNNAYNGDISGAGRVECIEFHPNNPDIMWVGTHSGGFWKTTDGGENWYTTSNELPALGISDIVVDPSNPEILFVGTGDRDTDWTYSIGLLKSIDGGESFQETGLNFLMEEQEDITEILLCPEDSDIIIVSTTNGIYKSYDGGFNWLKVKTGNFRDMVFKPGNSQVIYASTYNYNGGARLYKSNDQGENFERLNNTGISSNQVSRISIAVTPANPELVFFICSKVSSNHSGLYGMYKSEDSGESWSEILNSTDINLLGRSISGSDTEGYGWYTLSLAVSSQDPNLIFVGGINIWRSIDGGETWTARTSEMPNSGLSFSWVDQHEIRFNTNTQIIYSVHDGGVYKSENSGDTFEDISQGLCIMQLYRLGCSPSNENIVMTGCQDQFGMLYNEGVWEAIYCGEASEHFISNDDPNKLFGFGYNFGMIRSNNRGYSYSNISPPDVSNFFWLIPTIKHPTDNNTIYLGAFGLYKSTNQGNSWITLTDQLTTSYALNSIEVAYSNDNFIYACSRQNIWRSEDGGYSWESINLGLPANRYINDIAISELDPQQIWICLGKFNEGEKVFKSVDGGNTWTNISFDLPNVPVNTIVYNNNGDEGIYIGNDIGVFYKSVDMDYWVDFSNNLPNVVVTEIEIHKASNTIRAATHGRGLWISDLYDHALSTTTANSLKSFSISPNPVKNQLIISCCLDTDVNAIIKIKDMNGKEAVIFTENFTIGNQKLTRDVSNLVAGFYVVECIIDGKTQASSKMIKL